MRFPNLVRPQVQRTPIRLVIEPEGRNEYGEPFDSVEYEGLCNYQDKARKILTEQKELIEITGAALFDGDILPELPVITAGEAYIFGAQRRIQSGQKHRNPDGSVNYTEVLLI